ncbi:DUF3618 domain-containing protein [Actinocatenispora thailandica]|uniref:DUF3618 domain-containing protein n=1 Tax=Actinocatenispora thailandica TaxID=227318 RepID=UPI00194E8647|nr:DUF3618 domain-containing protein [Actinocatenispora thailandica]
MTPEQIRERMADTRAALSANVHAFRDRATPRALAQDLLHRRRGGRSPLPAGSAGAGEQSDSAGTEQAPNPVRIVAGLVGRQLAERPLLCAAAALAVGVAVAVLVPGPRRK